MITKTSNNNRVSQREERSTADAYLAKLIGRRVELEAQHRAVCDEVDRLRADSSTRLATTAGASQEDVREITARVAQLEADAGAIHGAITQIRAEEAPLQESIERARAKEIADQEFTLASAEYDAKWQQAVDAKWGLMTPCVRLARDVMPEAFASEAAASEQFARASERLHRAAENIGRAVRYRGVPDLAQLATPELVIAIRAMMRAADDVRDVSPPRSAK